MRASSGHGVGMYISDIIRQRKEFIKEFDVYFRKGLTSGRTHAIVSQKPTTATKTILSIGQAKD
jgi:hypothetical protein